MSALDLAALLAAVRPIAEDAAQATLRFYGSVESAAKADGSPVTAADQAAEDVILPRLRALTPDIPVVSEEEASKGLTPEVTGDRFWLVDPLDGTKEFLSGNGEFTVNIALIELGAPVLGVVVIPARGQTFAGAGPGTAGSSLKLCLIAQGEADLYPRLGTTMEWDIAAGHAVLNAAGGRVETVEGQPFTYGKPAFRNPHFAAFGKA
jgi:3'(2'), 5'-bisphosphate nucleotidase